jgi:hypothetical protein
VILVLSLTLFGTGATTIHPASGQGRPDPALTQRGLILTAGAFRWAAHASSNVWLRQTTRFQALRQTVRERAARLRGAGLPPAAGVPLSMKMFNKDPFPLPQNETTVVADPVNIARVVGGYNDYRGLLVDNFTGWTTSTDGGNSTARDGQIPPTTVLGTVVPSQGDPALGVDAAGNLFMATFHFDSDDFSPNGITIARSPAPGNPKGVFSAACGGGADPDCWPVIKVVTANTCTSSSGFFDDKPYIAADPGSFLAGGAVYVTWTRFPCSGSDLSSYIMIVKCNNALAACSPPLTLESTTGLGSNFDFVQLSHLTVGSDGNIYVTWVKHSGDDSLSEVDRIRFQAIGPLSGTSGVGILAGGPRTVATESQPIPWGTAPYPAYYRSATYPHVGVRPGGRIVVVWDRRTTADTLFDFWWFDYGAGASIAAKYSDDLGRNWSAMQTVSNALGHQDQPSVCISPTGQVVVAYYSNQNDARWSHAQDVYVSTSPNGAAPYTALRVTAESNDTEADPLLSDLFIGDYLEVTCRPGRAYVHYTANYAAKSAALLGGAFPIRQQDNFLARLSLP